MTTTAALPTFGKTRFVAVEHSSVGVGSSFLAWAPGGLPTLIDHASAAMLGAFSDPLTPRALADDLEAVFGLGPEEANRSAMNTAYMLRVAGLLLPEGQEPNESWHYHYPYAPST